MRADDRVANLWYYVRVANIEIREYIDNAGRNYYKRWLDDQKPDVFRIIVREVTKMRRGNLSKQEFVRAGVYEYKINQGPGYRIYYGKDGDRLIILLIAGRKNSQRSDIDKAVDLWAEYERSK